RTDEVEAGRSSPSERWAFRLYRWLCRRPWAYRWAARAAAVLQEPLLDDGVLRRGPGPLAAWTAGRDFPPVARRTFRERWRALEADAGHAAAGDGPGAEGR
ncbi:MAG TPA: lactate utilization protein LutB domain-containing protein, partial [Bacillota bacterium]